MYSVGIVVAAITSYAESIKCAFSSPNFQIGSERIKVGQTCFDTKRFATRLNFGVRKKQIVSSADRTVHAQFSTGHLSYIFPGIHADILTTLRPKEATDLLDAGVVKANDITRTVFNQTHGFACCSARQCVQSKNSGSDSDCVSFLATHVCFFSAEGFAIHSLSCFKLFFGDCPTVLFSLSFFQC